MTNGDAEVSQHGPIEGFLRLEVVHGGSRLFAWGSEKRVLEAYAAFRQDAFREATVPAPPPTSEPDEKTEAGKSVGKDESLPVFVKRAWPSQDLKATAIVLWARDHAKKASLKPSEIETYWRSTPGKVPGNTAAVCANAVKKGLLHKEGGGSYSITGYGADEVKKVPRQ